MPKPSRRDQICQAAIALAARGGSHALTHQAIDAELGIAKGSTSYYYRTRAALITGVSEFLATQSRAVFHDLMANHAGADPSAVIDAYLAHLALARRDHIRARLALALDADCGPDQRTALAECLFSLESAIALMRSQAHPDPEAGASDLLDRLEGHIVRHQILDDPESAASKTTHTTPTPYMSPTQPAHTSTSPCSAASAQPHPRTET